MVVKIQAIEEGKVVKVTGMGIINLLAKSALVLVTQLCRVIADIIELLLKVTTITMLVTMRVQLIIELCMFKLSRAFSRASPLVIHMGVVTTICRMVKVTFRLITIKLLYIASPEAAADPSWYSDSGASSHVTYDLAAKSAPLGSVSYALPTVISYGAASSLPRVVPSLPSVIHPPDIMYCTYKCYNIFSQNLWYSTQVNR
ncbi:hypothetical protein ACOSP7_031843 [Xanthoceras sorbifolium]